jgi:hypothetical protein
MALGRRLNDRHLGASFVDVAMEAPGHKALAVDMDEVPRDVFPERHAQRPRQ